MKKIIYVCLFVMINPMHAAYAAAGRAGAFAQLSRIGSVQPLAQRATMLTRTAPGIGVRTSSLMPRQRGLLGLGEMQAGRQAHTLISPAFRYQCQRSIERSPFGATSALHVQRRFLNSSAELASTLKRFKNLKSYQILGITQHADKTAIEQAYLRLVRMYHPDLYLDEASKKTANELMKTIHEARDRMQQGNPEGEDKEKQESDVENNLTEEQRNLLSLINKVNRQVVQNVIDIWTGDTFRFRFGTRSEAIYRAIHGFDIARNKMSRWNRPWLSNHDKAIGVILYKTLGYMGPLGKNVSFIDPSARAAYLILVANIEAYEEAKAEGVLPRDIEAFLTEPERIRLLYNRPESDSVAQMIIIGELYEMIKRQFPSEEKKAEQSSGSGWGFSWPWSKK